MNTQRVVCIGAMMLLCAGAPAGAVDDGLAIGGARYRALGSCPRASGVGQAFSTVADGADGFLYNPAGLGMADDYEIAAMSARPGIDRRLYAVGAIAPFIRENDELPEVFLRERSSIVFEPREYTRHVVGVAVVGFGVDDIEARDDWGRRTGSFEDQEMMVVLGYGTRLFRNLAIGLSAMYRRQTLEEARASGYGGDIGVIYRCGDDRLAFSLVCQDIAAGLNWTITEQALDITHEYKESIPLTGIAGCSYAIPGRGRLSAEICRTRESTPWVRAGVEVICRDILAVRLGIERDAPACGWGVTMPLGGPASLGLDYSFRYDPAELAHVHMVSVRLGIPAPLIEAE